MKNKTQYNCAKLRFSLNKGRTLWNRPMLGLVWFDIPDWPDLMGLFCFLETVTHCQDHILKGYIWFVWSSTPYSGNKWECYLCETNHQRKREDRATKPVVCRKAKFCNCISNIWDWEQEWKTVFPTFQNRNGIETLHSNFPTGIPTHPWFTADNCLEPKDNHPEAVTWHYNVLIKTESKCMKID